MLDSAIIGLFFERDSGEIRVSLTPVQLAALEGEWTRECIFDLAK